VSRCVAAVQACLIGIPEERDPTGARGEACLERAARRCAAAAAARDALRAGLAARAAARCAASGAALATLLDARGLGFGAQAARCPVEDAAEAGPVLLLDCVGRTVACAAEAAAARTIPPAWELLGELDLDADALFPCVVDPAELGWGARPVRPPASRRPPAGRATGPA
jgi:hypothetical protein